MFIYSCHNGVESKLNLFMERKKMSEQEFKELEREMLYMLTHKSYTPEKYEAAKKLRDQLKEYERRELKEENE